MAWSKKNRLQEQRFKLEQELQQLSSKKQVLGNRSEMTVYVVHGVHAPWQSTRSTDFLADRLRDDGYEVVEIRYNFYDPLSQYHALRQIDAVSDKDIIIGHSWGGVLTDLSGRENTIEISSLHSDIKGTSDWLVELGDPEWVEGEGHSINDKVYDVILTRLQGK